MWTRTENLISAFNLRTDFILLRSSPPQLFTPLMRSILLKSDPTHTFRLMWTCTENNSRL